MLQTKEEFDRHLQDQMQSLRETRAASTVYTYLRDAYLAGKADDLKFLIDMPYDQGVQWVTRTFAQFVDLNAADPKNFPMGDPVTVTRLMRKYRKEQNAAKKAWAAMKKKVDASRKEGSTDESK